MPSRAEIDLNCVETRRNFDLRARPPTRFVKVSRSVRLACNSALVELPIDG